MSALTALAAFCGIEQKTTDAKGDTSPTSAETERAILQAMGIDAHDEDSAVAELKRLQAEQWALGLPPVCVVRQGALRRGVPVSMTQGFGQIRWTIHLENGEERTGEARFADLPLIARRVESSGIVERRAMKLPDSLPHGYHQLRIEGQPNPTRLIITPGRCWMPAKLNDNGRIWGIAAQLYLQRSQHNWGIGDLTDLRMLLKLAKQHGADVVGINPLHAMFPAQPEDASPYSPSDRTLLNILNIDIEAIPEWQSSPRAQEMKVNPVIRATLDQCRNSDLVRYGDITRLKMDALQLLFEAFEESADEDRRQDLQRFHQERQTLLDRACTFQALHWHFASRNSELRDCSQWPAEYRDAGSPAVQQFSRDHATEIRFQLWLQWIADRQLREAAKSAESMTIGLFRDLAVGAAGSGAEVWSHPGVMLSSIHIGAPPDLWNAAGQDWGLPAFHPSRLREAAYQPFIELLRANMRCAGALRIDHAMALQRLYWIPKGAGPQQGAYVEYPMEDLVGILALESHRNRCMVIGEDLGTVPDGFRERMAEADVLSYRLLLLERDEKAFLPAAEYPHLSLSAASSHDLPTLEGWWHQTDLNAKDRLNIFPSAKHATEARQNRERDRKDLSDLLQQHGLLREASQDSGTFRDAAHQFLGRTASAITLIQLDDITAENDQVNVPGTSSENPNWRRKQSRSLEQLSTEPEFARACALIREQRAATSNHSGAEFAHQGQLAS